MLPRVNQNKLTMFSFVVLYKFCAVFIPVTTCWCVLNDVSNSTQLCFGYFPCMGFSSYCGLLYDNYNGINYILR